MKKRSILVVILTLLLLMSLTSVHDEDPWQLDCVMESQQNSDAEEAICDDERPPSRRRSSRLTGKVRQNIPSIDDWPIPRLLEFLFCNDITAPVGASHQELFTLFMGCAGFQSPPADHLPSSAPRKAPAKRKHRSRNPADAPTPAAAPLPKRARAPALAGGSAAPANDAILSALSSIQSSLSNMNSRIQTLEARAAPSSSCPSQAAAFTSRDQAASSSAAGPSSPTDDVIPAPLDGITIPRRSLGSAVPISTGVPFYPPAAAISSSLRSQILAAVLKPASKSRCLPQREGSPCHVLGSPLGSASSASPADSHQNATQLIHSA